VRFSFGHVSEELPFGSESCESISDGAVITPEDLAVVFCDGRDAFTSEDVLAVGVEAAGAACHGPGLVDEACSGGGVEQRTGHGTRVAAGGALPDNGAEWTEFGTTLTKPACSHGPQQCGLLELGLLFGC
jgi:hypothetical protein